MNEPSIINLTLLSCLRQVIQFYINARVWSAICLALCCFGDSPLSAYSKRGWFLLLLLLLFLFIYFCKTCRDYMFMTCNFVYNIQNVLTMLYVQCHQNTNEKRRVKQELNTKKTNKMKLKKDREIDHGGKILIYTKLHCTIFVMLCLNKFQKVRRRQE